MPRCTLIQYYCSTKGSSINGGINGCPQLGGCCSKLRSLQCEMCTNSVRKAHPQMTVEIALIKIFCVQKMRSELEFLALKKYVTDRWLMPSIINFVEWWHITLTGKVTNPDCELISLH